MYKQQKILSLFVTTFSLIGIITFIYEIIQPVKPNWIEILGFTVAVFILNYFSFYHPSKNIHFSMDSTVYLTCIYIYGISFALLVLFFSRLLLFLRLNRNVLWWKHIFNFSNYTLMIGLASYLFEIAQGTHGTFQANQLPAYLLSQSIYFTFNIVIISIYFKLQKKERLWSIGKGIIAEVLPNYLAALFFSLILSGLIAMYDLFGLFLFIVTTLLLSITLKKYFYLYEEIKQKAIHLNENKETYQSLILHNPEAICNISLHGNIIDCNPATEKIFGYNKNDMIRMNCTDILLEEEKAKVKLFFNHVVLGDPQEFETSVYHKNGKVINLQMKLVPIVVNFQLIGIFGIAKDITELKMTEEFLRRSDKLTVIGQLAAGVAHEIRNPLTSIRGFVQLLQSSHQDYQKEYYPIMLSELDRINFIVSELLFLSRPVKMEFEDRSLAVIFHDVIELLQSQALVHNIEIFFKKTDECNIRLYCVENKLKQVFINLIKNAIEAMPTGGKIDITLSASHEHFIVQVQDEGVGIPEQMIPRLGEPFYTTKESGTGLGLMICHRIIEMHQGSMKITSEIQKGTRIEITLPREQVPSVPRKA